jgi:LysR family transcriptional regulator, glycine cleavage system transcriptional activator
MGKGKTRCIDKKYRSRRRGFMAFMALEAAVAGHGVYLGAADIVDADLHAGRLMRCSSVGIRQGRFYLVFGEGVIRRKAVRQFRDWLLAESEGLRGSDQQS